MHAGRAKHAQHTRTARGPAISGRDYAEVSQILVFAFSANEYLNTGSVHHMWKQPAKQNTLLKQVEHLDHALGHLLPLLRFRLRGDCKLLLAQYVRQTIVINNR